VTLSYAEGRTLAPLTTLGLGGPAAFFVEARERDDVSAAIALAAARAVPLAVLGGGSNLLIADHGFPGLVVQIATQGVAIARAGEDAIVTAQAGESWDALVARAVDEDLAGIECLTGIPGAVGATPIQNVGAYGQEVAQVIEAVEVLDRRSGVIAWISADACGFGYRDSRFKQEPDRFVVLAVRFKLRIGGAASVQYAELARVLDVRTATPDLRTVAQAVRALRAGKGMLIEPGWTPSAGSFFTNPIVSVDALADVIARGCARGAIAGASELPQYPLADGRVKLAAGFLIERSGIVKGMRRGPVGVSEKHALALVHHGGGSTAALLALAAEIQAQVADQFGVRLAIEPVRW
jgi:UDP-N-acetylmuramate dehydrogenase